MWGFESWLERDHLTLMDFDPEVRVVSSQPFWLRWRDSEDRSRRHAPDFFARMAGGTAVVVDVRPDDRIPEKDAETFAVTAAACEAAGWEYNPGLANALVSAGTAVRGPRRRPRCTRDCYEPRGGWLAPSRGFNSPDSGSIVGTRLGRSDRQSDSQPGEVGVSVLF